MFVQRDAALEQMVLLPDEVTASTLFADPGADYGEVFTRTWVVEFILDLVGYTADLDLGGKLVVEPSCGSGAFLGPIIDRLLQSSRMHGRDPRTLASSIRAYDVLDENASLARKEAVLRLVAEGVDAGSAQDIAAQWVTTADFLLTPHVAGSVDYVIGNPPYIRLESVPVSLMAAYRRACPTMRGRSDVYVGFLESGLNILKAGGGLSFICADRWMRNQYGADLRGLVSARYAVETVISMHDVDAFEDDVSAYPAIVVLRNRPQGPATVVAADHNFGESSAKKLAGWIRRPTRRAERGIGYSVTLVDGWPRGRDFWPGGSPSQRALIAQLELRFPSLEDSGRGTRVGIGVATGCDDVYITRDDELVEESRLLPLLRAADIASGEVEWSGTYLVDPWDEQGLVDLSRFPRLGRYLSSEAVRLGSRHVARRRPAHWYRTIDRVDHQLTGRSKLVLPDIKAAAHPVLDDGGYYPHHNLYYVVSDQWNLEVLGGLLLSDIANLFVGAYCVRMRGGTYRFQAQYLRRIRVPDPDSMSLPLARSLASAFRDRDHEKANVVAGAVYGLSANQLATLARG